MKRIAYWMIGLVACLNSALAAAERDGAYQVEVVVFAIDLPSLTGGELWTQAAATSAALDEALPVTHSPNPDSPIGNATAILGRDARYRIIAQGSWIQSADTRSNSKPRRIRALNPVNPREVDGTIRFYMSRYLHVDMNIAMEVAPSAAASETVNAEPAAPLVYRINEQRRIKAQEVNYFDHPHFGVLMRVVPLGGR